MEIVPGIRARPQVTDEEQVAELRAKIASDQISKEEENERRRAAIINEVQKRIRDEDGPIRVTLEMEELGIAQQVWEMVQSAQLSMGMKHALRDEEDYDLDRPGAWLD